jgi:hypothetical protein
MKKRRKEKKETSAAVSARNGNLEVPVYFLKAKYVYTIRKMQII